MKWYQKLIAIIIFAIIVAGIKQLLGIPSAFQNRQPYFDYVGYLYPQDNSAEYAVRFPAIPTITPTMIDIGDTTVQEKMAQLNDTPDKSILKAESYSFKEGFFRSASKEDMFGVLKTYAKTNGFYNPEISFVNDTPVGFYNMRCYKEIKDSSNKSTSIILETHVYLGKTSYLALYGISAASDWPTPHVNEFFKSLKREK